LVEHLIAQNLKNICDKEGLKYDSKVLETIAWDCQGHMRDAINVIEEIAFLGDITQENLVKVSSNTDSEICQVIVNLGINLKVALETLQKLSSLISAKELYDQITSMLSDTAKIICGYDKFSPQRKLYLERIRDVHGSKVLEFLDYLLQRDKHIDIVGIQSDAVLLHHKFCSGGFNPKIDSNPSPAIEQPSKNLQTEDNQTSAPTIPYTQFSKMSMKEKSRLLRSQRTTSKEEDSEEEPIKKVPLDWPLPKEERIGGSSSDDVELSPQEFSHNLVGGRGDVSK
jgi:DNA polymerase III gamma/tau subunit